MSAIRKRARLFLTALTATTVLTATAQTAENESLNRSVTVEKDYVPTGIDANKINVVPEKEEFTPDKPVVTYSTWSKAEEVTATAGKIKSARYRAESESDSRDGVFRAGLGAYWQVLGEFYYPLLQGDTYLLDINLQHHSNWGHVRYDEDYRPRAALHNTEAALTFENQFRDARLISAVDFSHNGFDYYGRPGTDSLTFSPDTALTKGRYTTAGASFNLFSTNSRKSFQYNFGLDYHYLGRDQDIHNNSLNFTAGIRQELNTGTLGLDFAAQSNFAGGDGLEERHRTGLFTVTPYYLLDNDSWQLRIGGKFFGLASDSVNGQRKWPVAGGADIHGLFGLVPDLFYLEAGIGSDMRDNNYAYALRENRYITPGTALLPTYIPLDATLGAKIKVMEGFLFHVGARYQLLLNEHYFVNHTDTLAGTATSTFDVLYGETTHHIGVEAGVHYDAVKGLNLGLTARYNHWGVKDGDMRWEHAWHKPNWEINFAGSYRFLEKWEVGLSYDFMGGRYALVGNETHKMKPLNDLNVWVTYKALDWLSVFVNGKNLINVKGESFYGYRNFGINGMAGVTMTF